MTDKRKDEMFICGIGARDDHPLPQIISVCPAYGADWSQLYVRSDKAAQQCEVVEYTRTPSPALKLAVEALETISKDRDLNEWTNEFEPSSGAKIAREALAKLEQFKNVP